MRRFFFAVTLVLAGPLLADVPAAEVSACRASPTTECLADIGFAVARASDTLHKQLNVIDLLGQMGRVAQAEVLAERIAMLEGHSGAQAERVVGLRIAPYRMIEAFMQGTDLATVEAGPHGFLAKSALMQMAGVMQSGSTLRTDRSRDPERTAVLTSVLANTEGTRLDRLIAADILMNAGAEAAALAVVNDLPVDDSLRTNLSTPMIRLLGTERVWEIYQGMDRISVWWIADLAMNAENADLARLFLEEMYARALASEDPRSRAFDLRWVIDTAVKLEQADIADEAMALQRAEIDPAGPEMRALVQSHLAYGSPAAEVFEVLRRAEGLLETTDIDINVLFTLTGAYAELGDAKRAARLLKNNDAEARVWADAVLQSRDGETRMELLSRAKRALPDGFVADMLARVAAELAKPEKTDEERDWARKTAWELLEVDPPRGTYDAGLFYDRILNAALRLGSPDLRDATLTRSAETALAQVEPTPILQAALQHYRLVPGY